jgi:DNA-binding winged helix-turn-helix (wHTH) protein
LPRGGPPDPNSAARFLFGEFELDLASYELRRSHRRVHLERKAMELLVLLVQRAGQLVTRGEIVDALWGEGVFVDVENGIHTVVRKVRRALNEEVEGPDFLETVPGKGTDSVRSSSR